MNKVAAIAIGLVLILSGCNDGSKFKTRPKIKQQAEYDCKKHAPDKICEVPWKDKIVLYCHRGKIPRVVRDRDEC